MVHASRSRRTAPAAADGSERTVWDARGGIEGRHEPVGQVDGERKQPAVVRVGVGLREEAMPRIERERVR